MVGPLQRIEAGRTAAEQVGSGRHPLRRARAFVDGFRHPQTVSNDLPTLSAATTFDVASPSLPSSPLPGDVVAQRVAALLEQTIASGSMSVEAPGAVQIEETERSRQLRLKLEGLVRQAVQQHGEIRETIDDQGTVPNILPEHRVIRQFFATEGSVGIVITAVPTWEGATVADGYMLGSYGMSIYQATLQQAQGDRVVAEAETDKRITQNGLLTIGQEALTELFSPVAGETMAMVQALANGLDQDIVHIGGNVDVSRLFDNGGKGSERVQQLRAQGYGNDLRGDPQRFYRIYHPAK